MSELLPAISDAAAVIGDRWSPAVIAALLDGPLRYGELQERIEGIAPNILSARLKRLERDGLIVASPYSERPPRFEYRLTESGAELSDLLLLLAAWGTRRRASDRGPVHAVCGTPLEVTWWCPTCLEPASPDAGDDAVSV
ncbi:MAG: winged helix-turn-helix transcriptional regulator [Solirubrobacteraceae bacterium]